MQGSKNGIRHEDNLQRSAVKTHLGLHSVQTKCTEQQVSAKHG